MSEEEKISEILNGLKKIKGIHGAALIEKNGLIAGEALPGWVDSESVAAMVTLILKASERATKELNQGSFVRAIIENERGKLLFTELGQRSIVVITTTNARLGIINLKLDVAREELGG